MNELVPGRSARVRVPATSANLGPGFDCLGLALDWSDEYAVDVVAAGVTVRNEGEGAADLPCDGQHLVVRALEIGLRRADLQAPGLRVVCQNRIPQGRGLGSSSAAIVGGLRLAGALGASMDDQELVALAGEIEGHPDNVAAALLGGFVVSWSERDRARATRLPVHPDLRTVVFVPRTTSPTHEARQVLPDQVSFPDAVFNAARSALLVAAISHDPDLLFSATEDRLHQEQRRATYPESMALVDALRSAGHAAVISGAGPTVLCLASGVDLAELERVGAPGFDRRSVGLSKGATATRTDPGAT